MSFPRAAIRRFNEAADSSIPPIGTYDPKFVTDVSIASTLKSGSSVYDKWGRQITSSSGGVPASVASGAPLGAAGIIRSRSSSIGRSSDAGESSELRFRPSRLSFGSSNNSAQMGSSNNNNRRTNRDNSFQTLAKRRSSTTGIQAPPVSTTGILRRRSNTRMLGKNYSKPRVLRGRSPVATRTTPSGLRRAPSQTVTYSASQPQQIWGEILKDKLTTEGGWTSKSMVNKYSQEETSTYMELEPGEVYIPSSGQSAPPSSSVSLPPRSPSILKSSTSSAISSNAPANIFDEIQQLAESLQNELSEYKLKLGKERIRSQELEAKKLELEFINHSLKRQLEKYANYRESWEQGEVTSKSRVEELTRQKDELDAKAEELRKSVEIHEQTEFSLRERVAHLEQEKMQWSMEKDNVEDLVEQLQTKLKEETEKRSEVEEKIRELEGQMDTCYQSCESRMADTETMKETYEVRVLELNAQVQELQKTLEATRRELSTQKTLMELMKREKMEADKLDNYIS